MPSEFGVTDGQLKVIASQTEGFTGAQIKELAILAKSSAAQRGSIVIEKMDLEVATKKASAYKAVPTGFAGFAVEENENFNDY